jgi:hypothetical protein
VCGERQTDRRRNQRRQPFADLRDFNTAAISKRDLNSDSACTDVGRIHEQAVSTSKEQSRAKPEDLALARAKTRSLEPDLERAIIAIARKANIDPNSL